MTEMTDYPADGAASTDQVDSVSDAGQTNPRHNAGQADPPHNAGHAAEGVDVASHVTKRVAEQDVEPVAEQDVEPIAPVTEGDVAYLAGASQLVVAMDFDGTLAPFSDDPAACRAEAGAMEALDDLANLPGTTVLVISGRNLQQLAGATLLDPARAAQAGEPGDGVIRMVGSHGAEAADGPAIALSDVQRELLGELAQFAEAQAKRSPGMWVERKPLSVGLHVRTAEDKAVAADAISEFQEFALENTTCKVTLGKDILEVAVSQASKGGYMSALLERMSPAADAMVFAGDDTTDETVMAILREGRDIGIKVGEGPSAGNRRLCSTTDVRDFLMRLAQERSERSGHANL